MTKYFFVLAAISVNCAHGMSNDENYRNRQAMTSQILDPHTLKPTGYDFTTYVVSIRNITQYPLLVNVRFGDGTPAKTISLLTAAILQPTARSKALEISSHELFKRDMPASGGTFRIKFTRDLTDTNFTGSGVSAYLYPFKGSFAMSIVETAPGVLTITDNRV